MIAFENWKPSEISDLDEMERIQSLKHRENLVRGMGIIDFVNKMLYGTSGTVATMPPSLNGHNNYTNVNNINNNNRNINNEIINTNDSLNKSGINQASHNSKFEVKTKNYNPFENHSSFADVNT